MFLCKNDALGLAYTTVIALSPKFIGMHWNDVTFLLSLLIGALYGPCKSFQTLYWSTFIILSLWVKRYARTWGFLKIWAPVAWSLKHSGSSEVTRTLPYTIHHHTPWTMQTMCHFYFCDIFGFYVERFYQFFCQHYNQKGKKRSERRKHCALAVKAKPKIFAPPQIPFLGARDDQNLISWRWSHYSTFTYKPCLVRIDASNFELSW